MGEFDLIERLRAVAPVAGAGLVLGIGDDAALLDIPEGQQLVACTDTLNEGVHFLPDTAPDAIGHKALAVNLSDLAAMGAEPHSALLNLSLPAADSAWLDAFIDGFSALAREHRVLLAGGDTTRGPLSVTVTALGRVPAGAALARAGAREGDRIVISGVPGEAAVGLQALRDRTRPDTPGMAAAIRRLQMPTPRVALGMRLRGIASACIDISDGLAADLGHILAASGVGARIRAADLPVSAVLDALPADRRARCQLAGGDDYELCLACPAAQLHQLDAIADEAGVALSVIGEVVKDPGLVVLGPDGQPMAPETGAGFDHFSGGHA